MFVDEAGFSLLPAAVRTYAPRGQTPILRVPLTRDHLSVISAITPDGRLLMMIQKAAFNGITVVRFLKHDARFEQHLIDRLGQIIFGARLNAFDHAVHFVQRRDDNDRHIAQSGICQDMFQHLIAVHLRHLDVKQHHIESVRVQQLDYRGGSLAVKFGEATPVDPERLLRFVSKRPDAAFSPPGLLKIKEDFPDRQRLTLAREVLTALA